MDFPFFKNIVVSLRAVGPNAVLIVWLIAITVVAVYGSDELGSRALNTLNVFAPLYIGMLGAGAFIERK